MRRRPQGTRRVQQVAIGLQVHTHFATVTMRQDSAECRAHTVSQTSATAAAQGAAWALPVP